MTSLSNKIKESIDFCCDDNISSKDKDLLHAFIMDNLRITFNDLIKEEEEKENVSK